MNTEYILTLLIINVTYDYIWKVPFTKRNGLNEDSKLINVIKGFWKPNEDSSNKLFTINKGRTIDRAP